MNNLQQMIRKIGGYLNSNDLTNTDALRELAEDYVQCCKDFNKKMEECQLLLERKMHTEAMELVNHANPPLDAQAQILNFPQKKEWQELYTMYEWPAPPTLRSDVLETLQASAKEHQNLKPLLDAYRQIARSNDIAAKIRLLRQIVFLDSEGKEWQETLRKLEEKRFLELAETAKKAIVGKEYSLLKGIQQELLAPGWTFKPNALVLNKIEKVLESHRLEELKKLAESYLNDINNAYSNFDYDALKKALKRWQDLLRRERYIPEETENKQVAEAEEYYHEQQKIRQEKEEFDSLIQELRTKLEKEAPLLELEMLFNKAQMAGQEIPENVKKRFLDYKESLESIQRRKRLLRISAIAAAVLIVAGGIIFTISTIIMNIAEREWGKRIETALAKEPAAVSLKLLKDLETASPKLRKRPRILELEGRVNARLEEEGQRRQQFQELAAKIRQELLDFNKNRNLLLEDKAQAQRLIIDQTEENIYRELDREYKIKYDAYTAEQDKQYLKIINQLKERRKDFFVALEKEDFNKAAAIAAESANLKEKALQIKDLSARVKADNRRHLEVVEELNAKLTTEKQRRQKANSILKELRLASSVEELQQKAREFVNNFPGDASAPKVETLLANLAAIEKFAPADPKNPPRNSIFKADATTYNQLKPSQLKLFKNAKTEFVDMAKDFEKSPMYAIILKTNRGICDIYFTPSAGFSWSLLDKISECRLKILANENEETERAKLSFNIDFPNQATIQVGKAIYSGKLLYPEYFEHKGQLNYLAPHIKVMQKQAKNLQGANEDTAEQILVNACKEMLTAPNINPILRLNFSQRIINLLKEADPGNESYQQMAAASTEAEKLIPDEYNWLHSYQHNQRNIDLQKQLSDQLKKMAEIPLESQSEKVFYKHLYDLALSRQIVPAGYLRKGPNGFELAGLRATSGTGELWAVSEYKPYWRIIGEFAGSRITIAESEKTKLTDLELLYTPIDGRSTAELKAQQINEAKQYGIKNINWPDSWPIEEEVK